MSLPFTDEYKDGDLVQCQRCAKNIRVKYYDRDTVVVVSTQVQQTLALRCQYCGYVMCDSCAHPADSLFPTCPSCQREWGPYYFNHDVLAPSLSKASATVDMPPPEQPPPPSQLQDQDIPVSPHEFLGAGEADLFREELERKNRRSLRRIVNLAVILLLAGVAIFSIFGPGRPLLKKGLSLLSAQPIRSSTPAMSLTNTPVKVIVAKTSEYTTTVTPSPIKPSPTLPATTEPKPTNIKVATFTPTLTEPVASIAETQTAVSIYLPTPTETTSAVGECIPALSVISDDVGKSLCVTGIVVYTMQKDAAFIIYFSNDDGFFRIVIYDRVPNDIEKGVCIKVTGEIKSLTGVPVMALGYHDVIEVCSP